ncbi:MAG: glycyl-tRNA synthetase beta chain [Rhodothermales bacterium]|jgi:glycyl-tRNA synthetase beta chain
MSSPGQSMNADLLLELGCEELPPKTLQRLAGSLYEAVYKGLAATGIEVTEDDNKIYYTPRRLGFLIRGVPPKQPDQIIERTGPAISAAFDSEGNPTKAAMGFARSVGKEVAQLDRKNTDKGEWLYCKIEQTGKPLTELLYPILEKALSDLPVAKPMRWSDHDFSFVRPVHWLLVLHGTQVLEGELFGKSAGRTTRGHRIHSPGPHSIAEPAGYESTLKNAFVVVDPATRKEEIQKIALQAGLDQGGNTRITDALLDEVTNIIEWPVAVACHFEEDFLEVPQEALIASMEDHQKFFPVLNPETGKLSSAFVVIANIQSKDIDAVQKGFEKVIRPRLADARFFWEQDQKRPFGDYAQSLNGVVFQKSLGTVGDKSRRIASFASAIAEFSNIDPASASRAALLSKCDLVTHMVGEFPELQGTMGAYYAQKSGEPEEVARAIGEHYSPRFAGDHIPASDLGRILSIADRMDTLLGIFAAGLKPTGNKDPFALRRSALAVARILTEAEISLTVDELLDMAVAALSEQIPVSDQCRSDCRAFILERLRNYFLEQGFSTNIVNSVFSAPVGTLPDLHSRLKALAKFVNLPEAESLIAANKRIGNILRKSEINISGTIDENILIMEEERMLFRDVVKMEGKLRPLFEQANYDAVLQALAGLDEAITAFFDHVMVMDEDLQIRSNRLALLARLKSLFDGVADLATAS